MVRGAKAQDRFGAIATSNPSSRPSSQRSRSGLGYSRPRIFRGGCGPLGRRNRALRSAENCVPILLKALHYYLDLELSCAGCLGTERRVSARRDGSPRYGRAQVLACQKKNAAARPPLKCMTGSTMGSCPNQAPANQCTKMPVCFRSNFVRHLRPGHHISTIVVPGPRQAGASAARLCYVVPRHLEAVSSLRPL